MILPHTCVIIFNTLIINNSCLSKSHANTYISGQWKINALIHNIKWDYVFEINPMMAYMAREKYADVVLGNQKALYYRIRDYVHRIIDTNT